jgi:hypothetical protein
MLKDLSPAGLLHTIICRKAAGGRVSAFTVYKKAVGGRFSICEKMKKSA